MKNLIRSTPAIICLLMLSCKNSTTSESKSALSTSVVTNSGSGDDTYIELTSNTTGKAMQIQGLTKMYLAANGKVRDEMQMTINGKPSSPIIAIGNIEHPYESTDLDDSAKTYTINHIDTGSLSDNDNHKKFTVTKIGEEKIGGFNCVHAQIIATTSYGNGSLGMFNGSDTTDLWLSPDVPLPDAAKKYIGLMTSKLGQAFGNEDVAKQLVKIGCVGFPAKFQMHGKNVNSISQITKIDKMDFPASLFEIPTGYKEVKE